MPPTVNYSQFDGQWEDVMRLDREWYRARRTAVPEHINTTNYGIADYPGLAIGRE